MNQDPPPFVALPNLLNEAFQTYGNTPFLECDNHTLTYTDLDALSNSVANALLDHRIREGERVVTLCANGLPIVATIVACIKIGAIFCPLNALLTGHSLTVTMGNFSGSYLVCDADLWAEATSAGALTLQFTDIFIATPDGRLHDRRHRPLKESTHQLSKYPELNISAPARQLFTSSTTGESKAVLWSRKAELLHATKYAEELVRIVPGETIVSCLPLFHVTCQGTFLGTLLSGGRLVLLKRFNVFTFWDDIRAANAVFFPYVGTIISSLMSRQSRNGDADNPVQRAMGSGVPSHLWSVFEQRFAIHLEDVWGQTETASCWTCAPPTLDTARTVGVPVDRFELKLVDDEGQTVPQGTSGEAWIRPHEEHVIFDGYINNGLIDPAREVDGWYRTGDTFSQVENGAYRFEGRLGENIRRRGEMVSPVPIEEVALRHSAVLEAAAVAIPADDGVDDEILLCIVLNSPSDSPYTEISTFLRQELPKFMVPRFLRVLDELPKTPTTRVRRIALRQYADESKWDIQHNRWANSRATNTNKVRTVRVEEIAASLDNHGSTDTFQSNRSKDIHEHSQEPTDVRNI